MPSTPAVIVDPLDWLINKVTLLMIVACCGYRCRVTATVDDCNYLHTFIALLTTKINILISHIVSYVLQSTSLATCSFINYKSLTVGVFLAYFLNERIWRSYICCSD